MSDDNDQSAPGGAPGARSSDGSASTGESDQRRFRVQKLFLKDVSFESPAAPGVFSSDSDLSPKISLQLNTENREVGENLWEVVLIVTVTSADDERTVYLAEVRQAGLFEISGFPDMDHAHAIGSYCPSILFPYAREVVSGMVQKGGFPQLTLQPINFDALFARELEKQRRQQADATSDVSADAAADADETTDR